ncbi:MAG: hypothetical protein H0V63_03535 [Burkholderiaceae bacterium]|nr:hypothetical protein [Burkholderiaceae bacterium]
MKIISTADAPIPAGHYSQGIEGLVFVSGMLPTLKAAGGESYAFDHQVRSALRHCERVLVAAGWECAGAAPWLSTAKP